MQQQAGKAFCRGAVLRTVCFYVRFHMQTTYLGLKVGPYIFKKKSNNDSEVTLAVLMSTPFDRARESCSNFKAWRIRDSLKAEFIGSL